MKKKHQVENLIDVRDGTWPDYYDDTEVENYQEYFIKGTNVKLGFKYYDVEQKEQCFYCIVGDGYDYQDPFDTEEELLDNFNWFLQNKDLTWRYYE